MSGSEATEAAKRHFAHQHPDMADEHAHTHQAPKRHSAPTGQQHNYVVKVCNLTGLSAVCEHDAREAAKEEEAPQLTGPAMKEPTEVKERAGMQEGTFVLSVVPKEHTHLKLIPRGQHTTHYEKSVGDQTIDPFYTASHHRFTEDKGREEKEEKEAERELRELHEKDARLKLQGAQMAGKRAQIEAYEQTLEKKKEGLEKRIAQHPANGNLGRKKTQKLHQQRQQQQHAQEALARTKARHARAVAENQHQQSKSAHALTKFHKGNSARARFNFAPFTDRADPTLVDEITLKATMSHHCSWHPTWKVFEEHTHKLLAAHNGLLLPANHLMPPVVDEIILTRILPHVPGQTSDAYWLRSVRPRTYKIQLHTCHATKEILIHVYPQIKSGFSITIHRDNGHLAAPEDSWLGRIEKYEQKFKKILSFVQEYVPRLENVEVDILAQGILNLSNTWEEEKGSNEVVWKASVDADMDLIELAFRLPLVNINPLPSAVKDKIGNYFDAGIYFTFDGKVAAKFAGAWTDKEKFRMESGGVEGSIALGVEGLITFGKDGKWGRVEASGTSTMGIGAEIHAEGHAFLLGLYWDWLHPFEAELKIYGPYGWKIYDWKQDLWSPSGKKYLPQMHILGGA